MTEGKAQAAEQILRALGAAFKTYALYPGPHPVTQQTVQNLFSMLHPYVEAYGPFSVRIGKYALTIDGIPYKEGLHASLSMHLYTRGVAQIKIMPAVSEQSLTAFASIIAMDRRGLEAAGSIRQLMRQSGVGNIQVTEMALETDEDLQPADLNAIFEWLGRGDLAPEERERILDMLRAGPEQARVLLERAFSTLDGLSEGLGEDDRVQDVYQVLRSLDRMMLDEPFEDQERLYANLAEAQLRVREPLKSLLARALLHPDGQDVAARLGEHLTTEQLAQVIHGSLGGGDVAEQVTAFLRALRADPQKTTAVLTILDARLRQPQQGPSWLTDAVVPRLDRPARRAGPELPQEFTFTTTGAAESDEAAERLKASLSLDEDAITHQVIRTLVDDLGEETYDKELVDIGDALAGHLPWLAQHQEYAALAAILERLKTLASVEVGTRRKVVEGILKRVTDSNLLDRLLAALWAGRDTVAEKDIQACLKPLADDLVEPLVRALGMETRGPMRAMICDLLISLGGEKVDALGRMVDDQRWYVVRNVANVLGRLHSPRAVAYLNRLVQHPDYRVRRETVMALASIGTDEAQAALASFFGDPDERIQGRVLQSLDSGQAWRVLPQLLTLLERRDPFERQFALKRAALEILARLGARQSLPALRNLSRRWFVFGARARELRHLARLTADVIEGHASPQDARPRSGVEIEPD